ncbi:hypothetical protein BJF81_13150 [Ornithinimicrobium sp. CNJ-824]|uniref:hypothetical protein n=1 Tax=Ornithinimicrobium sp. CNJ-824 TaxID=1904966 RepID=UPI00095BEF70|nr:hypothetical protein [Ornithinimicrobium sp. CNJ-824]OLT22195.1 hypothetical protein BJF81_13150 [Ornithinimicrobium sp. CNJ-824]
MNRPSSPRPGPGPVSATLAVALAVVLAGCGGGTTDPVDSPESAADATTDAGTDGASTEDAGTDDGTDADADVADSLAGATSTEELEEMVEGMVDDLAEQQEAQGGGSATLTVGDEEWTFDSVLCAFGEEEIGQEGAEVVVSSIQDGLQFYVSIDDFGHSVSLNDVENFEDPSVAISSDFAADDFIEVDGKDVSGEVLFVDEEGGPVGEGSFEATCP